MPKATPTYFGARSGTLGVTMTNRSSRSVYDARMHRVLEHIDNNIASDLDLNTLAAVATFSPYHFHRVFAALTGERLGEFMRRRRLEIGAARLAAQPALGVLDVALSVGFGSSEAFSRAFKAHFGANPTEWRRNAPRQGGQSNPDQLKGNRDQAQVGSYRHYGGSHSPPSEHVMQIRLVTLKPVHIAYLRHQGPYGDTVGKFWDETVSPWLVANAISDAPQYGISHDDPSITEPTKCRYDACVEVSETAVLSGDALRARLPGGKYAVVDYTGPASEVGQAWSEVLRDWLPSSGLQLDGRPCFEYYPPIANDNNSTGEFTCQLCVPVAPL